MRALVFVRTCYNANSVAALTGALEVDQRSSDLAIHFLWDDADLVRPENVSAEALALVTRYAANDNIAFGAQTGSPRLLRALRRGHTVEDIYQAAELTLQAGLKPIIDFIFGLPGEMEEDQQLSLRLMEHLAAMGASIHSHTFMPLPGTPLAAALPGQVTPEVESILGRLSKDGLHIGQWRKQEELAAAVCR
jgi:radical SAM superfamily enzyme YgiQ (UPF0313 family)